MYGASAHDIFTQLHREILTKDSFFPLFCMTKMFFIRSNFLQTETTNKIIIHLQIDQNNIFYCVFRRFWNSKKSNRQRENYSQKRNSEREKTIRWRDRCSKRFKRIRWIIKKGWRWRQLFLFTIITRTSRRRNAAHLLLTGEKVRRGAGDFEHDFTLRLVRPSLSATSRP